MIKTPKTILRFEAIQIAQYLRSTFFLPKGRHNSAILLHPLFLQSIHKHRPFSLLEFQLFRSNSSASSGRNLLLYPRLIASALVVSCSLILGAVGAFFHVGVMWAPLHLAPDLHPSLLETTPKGPWKISVNLGHRLGTARPIPTPASTSGHAAALADVFRDSKLPELKHLIAQLSVSDLHKIFQDGGKLSQ